VLKVNSNNIIDAKGFLLKMKMPTSIWRNVPLLAVGLLATVCMQIVQATQAGEPWLVRGKVEALTQLRNFLPRAVETNFEANCNRYAILLGVLSLNEPVNYNKVIEIARKTAPQAAAESGKIVKDELIQLFMDAITEFEEQGQVNSAMRDLYDCAEKRYKKTNSDMRNFLDQKDLTAIVQQHKWISEQPAAWLQDPQGAKADLKKLHSVVQNSARKWFANYDDIEEAYDEFDDGASAEAFAGAGAAHAEEELTGEAAWQAHCSTVYEAINHAYFDVMPQTTTDEKRCRIYSEIVQTSLERYFNSVEELADEAIRRAETNATPFGPNEEEVSHFLAVLEHVFPKAGEVWEDMEGCVFGAAEIFGSPIAKKYMSQFQVQ
jgi:hypothetical protein